MTIDESEYIVKKRLDKEVLFRNSFSEVSDKKPDPILIAKEYKDEYISLICALFAYGKVEYIIRFLRSLDMTLLDKSEKTISKKLANRYYRFQNSKDIIELFITLSRFKKEGSLESTFISGYRAEGNVIDGINEVISKIYKLNPYRSRGYQFLIGKITKKRKGSGALKRWNMYLRWMVRRDEIDMGLWSGVERKDLIIPLDTHTFNVAHSLGLLKRKSYDLQAAWELTQKLKTFDEQDPIKYDFALYRIGQEKILS